MHIFPYPEPPKSGGRILPVFIPFAGCARRCVFCAQDIQTGRKPAAVRTALDEAAAALRQSKERGAPPPELAFFGGTFTALEREDFLACLRFASDLLAQGAVRALRCSTRPDAVSPERLAALKTAGFTLVELGVQSFHDQALTASNRGYGGEGAKRGCDAVQQSGLGLGIQLMPGMPGLDHASARADAALAASFGPACVRLYPCLVLRGTALAALWRAGGYVPWTLASAVASLADACLLFWRSSIPVIRMGLAEEPGLGAHVLAGPRHPAIGDMAKGLALYTYIRAHADHLAAPSPPLLTLYAPRRCQGVFWGHRGCLEPAYAALGLTRERVRWWDKRELALTDDCLPRPILVE